ncbi:unnamed protein product, partial [Didymodactylos carnosus]
KKLLGYVLPNVPLNSRKLEIHRMKYEDVYAIEQASSDIRLNDGFTKQLKGYAAETAQRTENQPSPAS